MSTNYVNIKVNDIYNELNEENKRLNYELMFGNNCLNVFNKYKLLLNKVFVKYETIIDSVDKQDLNRLEEELKSIINSLEEFGLNNVKTEDYIKIKDENYGQLPQNNAESNRSGHKPEQNEVYIEVNDILDQLSDENNRLNNELIFENNCLNVLNQFKQLLSKVIDKFEAIIDLEDRQELSQLKDEFNSVLKSHPNYILEEESDHNFDYLSKQLSEDNSTTSLISPSIETNVIEIYSNEFLIDITEEEEVPKPKQIIGEHNYDATTQSYICPIPDCKKSFQSRYNLYYHNRRIHGSRDRFPCDHPNCTKSFNTQTCLKTHMRSHSTERPIHCPIEGCPKKYKDKTSLKCHLETHSNQWYKCSQCEKRYKQRTNLVTHERKHREYNERNIVCMWYSCNKRFENNEQLTHHMNRHQNIRPFKCRRNGCPKAFFHRIDLHIHIMNAHKKATNV